MARLTEDGIKGMVGNLIFYTVNGKSYVRSRPEKKTRKRNQTMKPLNSLFGTVSKYGSGMVKLMSKSFLFPFKLEVYNRVRGWMRNQYAEHQQDAQWELSASNSGMCQLNGEIDLRDYLKTTITVKDNGKSTIVVILPEINPKKNIKVPLRTMKVNIKLIVVTSTFRDGPQPYFFCTDQYSFIYKNAPVPARTFEFKTKAGKGDIAIVAMALEFETSDSAGFYSNDKRWLPAAIVAMGKLK